MQEVLILNPEYKRSSELLSKSKLLILLQCVYDACVL